MELCLAECRARCEGVPEGTSGEQGTLSLSLAGFQPGQTGAWTNKLPSHQRGLSTPPNNSRGTIPLSPTPPPTPLPARVDTLKASNVFVFASVIKTATCCQQINVVKERISFDQGVGLRMNRHKRREGSCR